MAKEETAKSMYGTPGPGGAGKGVVSPAHDAYKPTVANKPKGGRNAKSK